MKIRFHAVDFTPDIKLLDFLEKKINKLDVCYTRIVDVDANFKVKPFSNRGNKLVEIKLRVPGKEFFVRKYSTSYKVAINRAVIVLKRSLLRYKEKFKILL